MGVIIEPIAGQTTFYFSSQVRRTWSGETDSTNWLLGLANSAFWNTQVHRTLT
jgi:hypothetical protein